MRPLWLMLGGAALTLGVIGIAVPLLPTVPFMLLAALCFSKSSPRLHDWLTQHALFGPPIAAWRASGAISTKAKRWTTVSIAATFSMSVILGLGWKILTVQAIALLAVLVFIWSRPSE